MCHILCAEAACDKAFACLNQQTSWGNIWKENGSSEIHTIARGHLSGKCLHGLFRQFIQPFSTDSTSRAAVWWPVELCKLSYTTRTSLSCWKGHLPSVSLQNLSKWRLFCGWLEQHVRHYTAWDRHFSPCYRCTVAWKLTLTFFLAGDDTLSPWPIMGWGSSAANVRLTCECNTSFLTSCLPSDSDSDLTVIFSS